MSPTAAVQTTTPSLHRPPRWSPLLRPLQDSDPGLLRLIQAIKTVLAVGIAIAIFWRAELLIRLFGAIGTAFLMQCTSTGTRRRQMLTMAVTAAVMMIAVGLGAGLYRHPTLQDALLVVMAFLVFYVRRFLPDQGLFPVFGFVLCLLATARYPSAEHAVGEMRAIATGLPIAFALYFYLLPPNWRTAFADQLDLFCSRCAAGTRAMELALRDKTTDPISHPRIRELRRQLEVDVAFNQQLVEQWPSGNPPQGAPAIGDLLLWQYEVLQSLNTLVESVRPIIESEVRAKTSSGDAPPDDCADTLPPELPLHLAEALHGLARGFRRLSLALRQAAARVDVVGERRWDRLHAAVLNAGHPLCPEVAQMFTALVAGRQLARLQDRAAGRFAALRAHIAEQPA